MPSKMIHLPSGRAIPALGFGMWYFREDAGHFSEDVELVRQAFDSGYRVFDAAQSYGFGSAEEALGEALAGHRSEVFLTSKIAPSDASYENVISSCEKSLERMKTDYLDLYLLHWSVKSIYFEEILEAFLDLKEDGRILDFGVSHFDLADLQEWLSMDGAEGTAINQAHFNLFYRQPEKGLLAFCQKKKIPLAAFAPQDINPSAYGHPILRRIAADRDVTTKQIALAWVISFPNVAAITKAPDLKSMEDSVKASKIRLTEDELQALNLAFPPV